MSPTPFSTVAHCSDCAAADSTVSGVTVGSVRGRGLMVFDRQCSQRSSPSPGGPNEAAG